MPVDLDFSRTANLLIRERGEIAAIEAAQRADAMLDSATMVGVGDAVLSCATSGHLDRRSESLLLTQSGH